MHGNRPLPSRPAWPRRAAADAVDMCPVLHEFFASLTWRELQLVGFVLHNVDRMRVDKALERAVEALVQPGDLEMLRTMLSIARSGRPPAAPVARH